MKNKNKKIASLVIFLVLFLCIFSKVDRLFERKYSYTKYADFYAQKENFDVLFFGTSHVLNAIYPMELWNDYGIVSYNMANNSENICTNYWQLKNILEYTTPKVVVVDLYAVDGDSKVNLKYLHNLTDRLPLSINKIKMVMDLLPKEEWAEYLFDFSIYHSRWNELTKEDIKPPISTEKGAELRTEVVPNQEPTIIEQTRYSGEDRINKQYLQKIIDLCKSQNIEVILTYLPYSAPESHQEVANWGYIIAQKNNVPYLDFFYENFSLNYLTDCADDGSHLNASGARKITDYFGQYIKNHYEVQDRRNDETYTFWNDDYQEYEQYKMDCLNHEKEVASYLLLLNDKNLETTVYLSKDSDVKQDEIINSLLINIESMGNITYCETDNYNGMDFEIEVRNKNSKEVISSRVFTKTQSGEYEMNIE